MIPIFKPTYHNELDHIRRDIKTIHTDGSNYKLRLFLLKQWMCFLQQMGADTTPFLDVSEVFKLIFPWNHYETGGVEKILSSEEERLLFPAIDHGYGILEDIFNHTGGLTQEQVPQNRELPGRKLPPETTMTSPHDQSEEKAEAEPWPQYQRDIRHTGSVETDHVLSGRESWNFPIGFAWEARPVLNEGVVYAASPGMRTIMYALDLESGQEKWSSKQLPAIVTDQLYWTPCAAASPHIAGDEIILRTMGSRGNQGETHHASVINKNTGEIKRNMETGHVDYRSGQAPLSGNEEFAVYPLGRHDIEENPPICQPFNRLVCRRIETGREAWVFQMGPTLCEPAVEEKTVVTGTMDGGVFCLDLGSQPSGHPPVRWQFQARGGVNRKPLIKNGKVIFGANDGMVYCLSEDQGRLLWSFESDGPEVRAMKNFTTPLSDQGKIYLGSANGYLYCLSEREGRLLWKCKGSDWFRSCPVKSGNRVIAAAMDGTLSCWEESGDAVELLWETRAGTHQVFADLVVSRERILVTTSDLFLWCYDLEGRLIWKKSLIESAYDGERRIWLEQPAGGAYFQSKITAAEGKIFFGTPSHFIYGLNAETGEELWKFEMGAAVSVAPVYSKGRVFAGQQGGEEFFYSLDAATGKKIWQQSIGWVWGSCTVTRNKVFIPCIDGYATCLDEESGAVIWRHRTNSSLCTEPTIGGDTVYFGGWDHFMYAFELSSGRIKWSRYFDFGSDSGSQIALGGKLYFPCPGSQFRCLNGETGDVEWNISVDKSNFNVTPAYHDGRVFASAMIGRCLGGIAVGCKVYCLDIETREIIWTHEGAGHTAPIVAGGRVYFGSLASPYIYCVDEKGERDGTTKCYWKFRMDNRVEESCGAWYGNRLYILTSGGYVHALE